MEKYIECNRELTLKNQSLRMQIAELITHINKLNKRLIEERIAHESTKRLIDKGVSINNTGFNELISTECNKENNYLNKSHFETAENNSMRNVTVRRKRNKLAENHSPGENNLTTREKNKSTNEIKLLSEINTKQQFLFPDAEVNADLSNSVAEESVFPQFYNISTNMDGNNDEIAVRFRVQRTEDISENPIEDSYDEQMRLRTITEEQSIISTIDLNNSETVCDDTDFTMQNLLSSTPNKKYITKELKVQVKRLKMNSISIQPSKINQMKRKKIKVKVNRLDISDRISPVNTNKSLSNSDKSNVSSNISTIPNSIVESINKNKKSDFVTSLHIDNTSSFNCRPKRRAATAITSYAETKINLKMRNTENKNK